MSGRKKILPDLMIIPGGQQTPVKHIIPPEEKTFLDLLANIVADDIISASQQNVDTGEKDHPLHQDI